MWTAAPPAGVHNKSMEGPGNSIQSAVRWLCKLAPFSRNCICSLQTIHFMLHKNTGKEMRETKSSVSWASTEKMSRTDSSSGEHQPTAINVLLPCPAISWNASWLFNQIKTKNVQWNADAVKWIVTLKARLLCNIFPFSQSPRQQFEFPLATGRLGIFFVLIDRCLGTTAPHLKN